MTTAVVMLVALGLCLALYQVAPAAPPAINVGSPPVNAPAAQPVAGPPGGATPVASPPAGPAPMPISADMPVEYGGRRAPIGELFAAHQAALEVGLDDPETRRFITTVYRASRGDDQALRELQGMVPAAGNPAPAAPMPVAAPGTMTPAATPGGAPAPGARPDPTQAMMQAVERMLQPLATKVQEMYGGYQTTRRDGQVQAIAGYIKEQAATFPTLSAVDAAGAAARVYDKWDAMNREATANRTARPTHQDLARLISDEENYAARFRPAAAAPATPSVVRMDEPASRVPGLPLPNRGGAPAAMPAMGVGPTMQPVATSTPAVGTAVTPAAATVNANPGPMTLGSLTAEIEAQARALGVETR